MDDKKIRAYDGDDAFYSGTDEEYEEFLKSVNGKMGGHDAKKDNLEETKTINLQGVIEKFRKKAENIKDVSKKLTADAVSKFEEFKKMGKTILIVSHDLSSISKYCDRVVLLNQGVKLGEGTPKEMIDAYKQVLVGQYPLPDSDDQNLLHDESITSAARKVSGAENGGMGAGKSKDSTQNANVQNPDLLEYGTRQAVIEEYGVEDSQGRRTSAIIKGQKCSVHMTVRFLQDIEAPIFAFTIKNIKGVEITGTNTMVEKAFLQSVKKGEVKHITFTQKIDLQGGEYLLSLGVTGYEKEDFVVYHRLYDVLNITVISDKDTVGYYDMNSEVTVR